MGVPISGLSLAFMNAVSEAQQIKQYATSLRDMLAAGNVSGNQVIDFLLRLKVTRDALVSARDTPGMGQFVRDMLNDQARDFAADVNTLVTSITDLTDWIRTSYPTSAGGYLEERKIEPDGSVSVRAFTPAQTAPFRTRLDTFIGTID